jgi:hypothetical protein
MVRATIDLSPETRLASEPLAVDYAHERAVGLLQIREPGGSALVMGAPAQLRALAAEATRAAEQAEEMIRVAELLADAGLMDRLAG